MIHATSCLSPRGAPAPPARLFLPPARASRAAHDLAPLSRFRSRLTSATLRTRLLRPILRARSGDGEYLAATLSTHVVKVYRRGEGGALGALLELTGHGGAVTDVSLSSLYRMTDGYLFLLSISNSPGSVCLLINFDGIIFAIFGFGLDFDGFLT